MNATLNLNYLRMARERLHEDEDATTNDSTTDRFYRLAHGIRDAEDTDLEDVDNWVVYGTIPRD